MDDVSNNNKSPTSEALFLGAAGWKYYLCTLLGLTGLHCPFMTAVRRDIRAGACYQNLQTRCERTGILRKNQVFCSVSA